MTQPGDTINLTYPSKQFQSAAINAMEEGKAFRVDARLGRFRRKSLRDYIDKKFFGRGVRFSYIGVAMCGLMGAVTANAYVSGKYRVEYSESKRGLLLTFESLSNPVEHTCRT